MTDQLRKAAQAMEESIAEHARLCRNGEDCDLWDAWKEYRATLDAAPPAVDVERPRWLPNTSDEDKDAIFDFLDAASAEMRRRMVEVAETRAWGASWQSAAYTDERATGRLGRAVSHLLDALLIYRGVDDEPQREAMVAELHKRAADVANQAFMLADPARLGDTR